MTKYFVQQTTFGAILFLFSATMSQAQSSFIITMEQDGNNVVATGSGSIDLEDLSYFESFRTTTDELSPSGDVINIGSPASNVSLYGSVTGPSSFGMGDGASATTGSGDNVALDGSYLLVPSGYVSGSPLSNTATWDDTTLAGLGVTPGTYTWSWGPGGMNTFTLDAVAVPEPRQYGWGVLLAALAFVVWRRVRMAY